MLRSARNTVGRISYPVAVAVPAGVVGPAVSDIGSNISVSDLCRRVPGIGLIGPSEVEVVQVDAVAAGGIEPDAALGIAGGSVTCDGVVAAVEIEDDAVVVACGGVARDSVSVGVPKVDAVVVACGGVARDVVIAGV